jgi:hypothetical protein
MSDHPPTRRELRETDARAVALRQLNAHRAKRGRDWRFRFDFVRFIGGVHRWR